MLSQTEFQYRGIQVIIDQEIFGWSYIFQYSISQYFPEANYISLDMARIGAKRHVDRLLKELEFDDNFGKL